MKVLKKSLVITPAQAGMAIDRALLAAAWGFSRRKIRQMLDKGGVSVNQRVERFASYKVKSGDRLTVIYLPEEKSTGEQGTIRLAPEDILFDQEELIALNKPPLLASQATRSPKVPHLLQVLEDYLCQQGEAVKQNPKLILCHRLDKETSGILLVARSAEAAQRVMSQFKARKLEKTYLAVSVGLPRQNEWEVSCYLSKLHPKTGLVSQVHAGGSWSHTRFKVIAVNKTLKLCLLACYPSSGRTHQIRVHLQLSQLPIVGDKKYLRQKPELPEELQRLSMQHHLLHARSLLFSPRQNDREQVLVTAPLPVGMQKFCRLAKLAIGVGEHEL